MESLEALPLRCKLEVCWLKRAFNKLYGNLYLVAELGVAVGDRPPILEPSANDFEKSLQLSLCFIYSLVCTIEAGVKPRLWLRYLSVGAGYSFPDNDPLKGL